MNNERKSLLAKNGFKSSGKSNSKVEKEKPMAKYPSDYLSGGYFDSNNVIKPALFLGLARTMAKVLLEDGKDENGRKTSHIAKSQLRKFYDFVCDTEQDLTHNVIDEATAISEIARLDSWARECVSKHKATREFYRFIHDNVDAVEKSNTAEAVTAFKKHFEAIICFYTDDEKRNYSH